MVTKLSPILSSESKGLQGHGLGSGSSYLHVAPSLGLAVSSFPLGTLVSPLLFALGWMWQYRY